MSHGADIVTARTYHRRLGGPTNAFRYGVDYLLLDLDDPPGLSLLAQDGAGLFSIHRRDHGGPRHDGRGTAWVRETLASAGWPADEPYQVLLLTQPRFMGFWFCPVSFWLIRTGRDLRAVIAEVNNTFGERHSYLCSHPRFRPIGPDDTMSARKVFHVSPFQDVTGGYRFRFDISDGAVAIHIRHDAGGAGLVATLDGPRQPLTDGALLRSALRRPFGAMRVVALIYWQAARLWLKGARYRECPPPPAQEVTR